MPRKGVKYVRSGPGETSTILLTNKEDSQKVFEVLFQKNGGASFDAAVKAVSELHPNLKKRRYIWAKARHYLVRTPFAVDMLTALEVKGVDAHKVAEKISELINAKKKITDYAVSRNRTITKEEIDSNAIDKGVTHALKIGVGGGYAPEKKLHGIKDFSLSDLLMKIEEEENKKEE